MAATATAVSAAADSKDSLETLSLKNLNPNSSNASNSPVAAAKVRAPKLRELVSAKTLATFQTFSSEISGLTVNQRDLTTGETPFTLSFCSASFIGDVTTFPAMIAAGANVNDTDKYGRPVWLIAGLEFFAEVLAKAGCKALTSVHNYHTFNTRIGASIPEELQEGTALDYYHQMYTGVVNQSTGLPVDTIQSMIARRAYYDQTRLSQTRIGITAGVIYQIEMDYIRVSIRPELLNLFTLQSSMPNLPIPAIDIVCSYINPVDNATQAQYSHVARTDVFWQEIMDLGRLTLEDQQKDSQEKKELRKKEEYGTMGTQIIQERDNTILQLTQRIEALERENKALKEMLQKSQVSLEAPASVPLEAACAVQPVTMPPAMLTALELHAERQGTVRTTSTMLNPISNQIPEKSSNPK